MPALCAYLELVGTALVNKSRTARKLCGGTVKKNPGTTAKENIFILEEHNIFLKIPLVSILSVQPVFIVGGFWC